MCFDYQILFRFFLFTYLFFTFNFFRFRKLNIFAILDIFGNVSGSLLSYSYATFISLLYANSIYI